MKKRQILKSDPSLLLEVLEGGLDHFWQGREDRPIFSLCRHIYEFFRFVTLLQLFYVWPESKTSLRLDPYR